MNTPMSFVYSSATGAWLALLRQALHPTTPSHPSRNGGTKEFLHATTSFRMANPLVDVKLRKLHYRFAMAEPAYILEGRNDVSTLARLNPRIADFSDDGITFYGAYGVQLMPQMPYVIDCLKQDPNTRRAVARIWIDSPRLKSRDIPCTLCLIWMIRNSELHVVDNMRSNDLWWGTPYDWFTFTAVTLWLLLNLRPTLPDLRLGTFFYSAASTHLYDRHIPHAEAVTQAGGDRHEFGSLDAGAWHKPSDWIDWLWEQTRAPRPAAQHLQF